MFVYLRIKIFVTDIRLNSKLGGTRKTRVYPGQMEKLEKLSTLIKSCESFI